MSEEGIFFFLNPVYFLTAKHLTYCRKSEKKKINKHFHTAVHWPMHYLLNLIFPVKKEILPSGNEIEIHFLTS